jgi:hypothetical protein
MEQSFSEKPLPLLLTASMSTEDLMLVPKPVKIAPDDISDWEALLVPLTNQLPYITPLESLSNRPLTFTISDQIYTLVYFHCEEYTSGCALIEDVNDPKQSPPEFLPQNGVPKSTFFEAIGSRGLPQMFEVFERLSCKAAKALGTKYYRLGSLCAIDSSLVDATLSMEWADYTAKTNKAKVHLCFDINFGIPRKIILTEGKGAERPVADMQLEKGQTGVMDRGYQDHQRFDAWQAEGKYFVCRIRQNTQKTVVRELPIPPNSNIIFFAQVYLGDQQHRTQNTFRLVGFKVGRKLFWVVTNRTDLTALEIAQIYRLRWEIEKFFAWWKRHLNVYHLIARSPYGLMMQLLAGLITYLLLIIYFYWRYLEYPSLFRLRQLRRTIRIERALRSIPSILLSKRKSIFLFMERRGTWGKLNIIVAIF